VEWRDLALEDTRQIKRENPSGMPSAMYHRRKKRMEEEMRKGKEEARKADTAPEFGDGVDFGDGVGECMLWSSPLWARDKFADIATITMARAMARAMAIAAEVDHRFTSPVPILRRISVY
jgi:hypothetical protein